ncbi:MAG: FMN-binding protein [Acidimicrobiales bacterium]
MNEQFTFGSLSVKVTVTGSKVTNVAIVSLDPIGGRSYSIDDYAIPRLEQQVIAAGSAHIDGVSGATFTSQAFVDAVSNAMQKLGLD